MIAAPLQFRLRPGGRKTGSSCFMLCPKCDAPAFIRRSERMSEQTTHLTCHCTDSGCGHIFRADIVFVHTLVEGNIDRPDLNLPVCPRDQVQHVRPPPHGDSDDEPGFFDPDPQPQGARKDTG
ncbi:MAG: ogr/Delta-like zinc finger family protein [Sphingomonadales bacterium]|nr:ogr/Delta-like zinc finger family protein [Sphingomonadales bacterium]